MKAVPYSNSGFMIFGSYPVVNGVRVFPINNYTARVLGSRVQGSNDRASWTDLYAITTEPANMQFTLYSFANTTIFRYVRLLMPASSYGNLNELEFYQNAELLNTKAVTTFGTASSYSGNPPFYDAVFDGNTNTGYDGPSGEIEMGLDFG